MANNNTSTTTTTTSTTYAAGQTGQAATVVPATVTSVGPAIDDLSSLKGSYAVAARCMSPSGFLGTLTEDNIRNRCLRLDQGLISREEFEQSVVQLEQKLAGGQQSHGQTVTQQTRASGDGGQLGYNYGSYGMNIYGNHGSNWGGYGGYGGY